MDQAASNCCGHLLAALYNPLYSDVVGVSQYFDRYRGRCDFYTKVQSPFRTTSRAISIETSGDADYIRVKRRVKCE